MAEPSEFTKLGSLRLNSEIGDWWCDFDPSPLPVWGRRVSRGEPGSVVSHADGQLINDIHLDAVTVSLLGTVYGDRDQSGDPVVGLEACRKQLKTNLDALASLTKTQTTLEYHLYDDVYSGPVTVLGTEQGETQGPIAIDLAITLFFSTGVLTLEP